MDYLVVGISSRLGIKVSHFSTPNIKLKAFARGRSGGSLGLVGGQNGFHSLVQGGASELILAMNALTILLSTHCVGELISAVGVLRSKALLPRIKRLGGDVEIGLAIGTASVDNLREVTILLILRALLDLEGFHRLVALLSLTEYILWGIFEGVANRDVGIVIHLVLIQMFCRIHL